MGLYTHINKSNNAPELSYFDKQVTDVKTENTSLRPADGFITDSRDAHFAVQQGYNLITYRDLWTLHRNSDILQIIFNTRARKTFRGGFEVNPNFEGAVKEQETEIKDWLKNINNNGQSFKEVCSELDKDLNWADDAFLLCLKDYGFNSDGQIVKSQVKEFIRLHPLNVELVLDRHNRLGRFTNSAGDDNIAYFNPFDRKHLTDKPHDEKTGKQNLQAHYKVNTDEGYIYYDKKEIMHKSAFNPSLTYGYSPLFSLYQKTVILMLQDIYIKKYYGDDKPLKGLLVFNTQNKKALMKTFDELRAKVKKDPHSIKPIVAESSDARKPVEYIDMSKSLDEMQYSDSRTELRQQIGAMYGVSPMFQNDMSTGGGLNNEGLQITVTNEAISDRQDLFNDTFVDFVFVENLGFTDWTITVKPDIEEDLMAEEELEEKRLLNVQSKLNIGLEGSMDRNGKFTFKPGDLKLEEQESFSPFGLSKGLVQKADKKTISTEESKLNSKLDEELKSILGKLDFKTKPSEASFLSKVANAVDLIETKLKKTASSVFKGIYERFAKDTSKDIGTTFKFGEEDKEVITDLKNDPLYQESFENVSNTMSDNIKSDIRDSFGQPDFSLDKLIDQIGEQTDIAKNSVRRIVRTETAKLSIASQQTQLEKTGNTYNYFHSGVKDKRTGKDSIELMKLTKKGVSWDEYFNLTKQVSSKFNKKWTVNKQAPILHPNQRSRAIFKRVEVK